jgi:hypothetical protein
MLAAQCHCDYCKWHVYRYRSIPLPLPYPHHNSHSALSKYGRSFCRTLYYVKDKWKRSAGENALTLLHSDFITVKSLLPCNNSLPGNIICPPQSKFN